MPSFSQSGLTCPNGLTLKPLAPLANFTTWRVGGPAEWLAEPSDAEEIKFLINWARKNKLPCRVLGAGSNLLINDSGLPGLTLCMRKLHGSTLDRSSGLVEAWGGENIPTLARRAAKAGLHGLEWAIGIPGTVGGAAVMNAGAQGGSIAERLESVSVIPLDGTESFDITREELNFKYRYSRLQNENLLVLSARFRLEPGHNQQELTERTNQNLHKRTSSQPYHLPSCGSVFRNPEPLKAGYIIEKLGLKGTQIGGAEISKIHANFIVNTGKASAEDIDQLIKLIQEKVKRAYGFLLHPEVKRLGFQQKY